ncbi:helix-turn-helix domain-containing protein [Nocardia pseudovaccinii]|uniref:helix-turn-helix domain-containing protein n=1 Tax=Nocardia pseudovaccinii TaxID=189540 RepID=UPI001471B691|nr:helix-turn-helix transcriptional regulator [Nocardia pseudovaccinii]
MGIPPRQFDPRATAEALFGAELRIRRVAANLSLRQLAPLVLASHDLLAKIENANRRAQPDLVDRLDQVLGAGGDLRRLAEPFLKMAHHRPPGLLLEPENAKASLQDLIVDVRTADHTMAAKQVDDLIAYADAAEGIVRQVPGREQTPLLHAVAEARQLAGWMLFDQGNVTLAKRSFSSARRSAERVGAFDLVAFIGGPNASFMSTWCGDPERGAEQAYGSLSWARRSGNRRLAAFVTTMAARAHARMGEADLCARMLTEAETELSRHRPDEADPAWLEVFDEAALAGHRGSCLLDLGQPRQAVESLREQDSSSPAAFVRNRTIWQLEQAEAQLRMGEHEQAAALVNQALDCVAANSITPRVVRMFRSINLKLCIHTDHAVAATADRLAAFIEACV